MDIKYDLHIYLTEKWSKPHYILPSHTECNLPSNPIACIFSHCKIIEPLIFVHMNYILVECFIKEYQSRVKLSLFCCCRKAFSSLNKIRHRRSLFSREHKREAWSYQLLSTLYTLAPRDGRIQVMQGKMDNDHGISSALVAFEFTWYKLSVWPWATLEAGEIWLVNLIFYV